MPHIHEKYDFTVSAFIIHPSEPKLCLHYHKKLRKWLQIGGHIELSEDPLQALDHELSEEAGLELDKCKIIEPNSQPIARNQKTLPLPSMFNVHINSGEHKHIDLQYIIVSNTDELFPITGESPIIKWLTIDEIIDIHKTGEMYDGTLDVCNWIFNEYM